MISKSALELIINNGLLLIVFFIIYCMFFDLDKNNFKGANNYADVFYFTTSTQSTIGSSDIVPNTSLLRIVVSIHQIMIIAINAKFIIHLIGHYSK